MLLFKKVSNLQHYLQKERKKGLSIGFIPTMGALHKGHISLFDRSVQTTDLTVGSIFVNPTQFNEQADLVKYPRTPEQDIEVLVGAGCDVLFMPGVSEVYPEEVQPSGSFDFGYLDKPMEGAHRPGHFQGMAQVVKRLLDIVAPDLLFMGQKDFQQLTIVRDMLQQLNSKIELVMCPIVRETDGLAMSSRNVRLSPAQRRIAPNIFRTLTFIRERGSSAPPRQMEMEAMKMLSIPGMEPEYFEIVNGLTLEPVEDFSTAQMVVACTAGRVGDIRLIDNMVLKNEIN